jgi:archaellum biogenesis ATPase FlaH
VQGTPKSVVLLEGLEYIITQNDFETVLRFVNHLHDFVLAHDCAVIIVIDPRVLSTRELALLERSARIVEPISPVDVRAESAAEEPAT